MSDYATKLIDEAKAYRSGGKKKITTMRKQSKIQQTQQRLKLVWVDVDDLAEHFKKFVGYIDKKGNKIPGIAFPPPIDQKNRYLGILDHELEGFKKCWINLQNGIMFKWARGYGKTFLATWFIEFTMYYFGFPWIYLSSTEILTDVAFWIFRWARDNKLIISSTKGGKKNTYTSFELSTGGRMRIYDYMGEEMVGQHGWYIAMDDIVKKKWEERPSDNLKAIRQWLYSISFIRRKGLLIFGTRKFQNDPLENIEKLMISKGLVTDILVPYIMEGTFPEWEAVIDEDTGRELLSVPELYTWEELEAKKVDHEDPDIDPLLAWEAEMMQNPVPKSGGLAEEEDIHWTVSLPPFRIVRCAGTGVDLSWTEGTTSDSSAVVSCVMYAKKVLRPGATRPVVEPRYMFLKSDIGRYPVRDRFKGNKLQKRGVLEVIQEHHDYLKRYFPHVPYIVAIERNSGGIVIIDQARRIADQFPFARHICEDSSPAYRKRKAKDPTIAVRLGITHSKEKIARVFGELSYPIKQGICEFHDRLKGTELIDQITTFPRGRWKDGPDAAGMIKDELAKRWSSLDGKIMGKVLKEHFKKVELENYRVEWLKDNIRPWESGKYKKRPGGRR
jgi:hypothetical protein